MKVMMAAFLSAALGFHVSAQAAELKVLAGAAFAPALQTLGPQFEAATNNKLLVEYGIAGPIRQKIHAGEPYDVFILGAGSYDEAERLNRVAGRTPIASIGMAVAIKAGAARPTIDSSAEFKKALQQAKSLAYPPAGAIGAHLRKVAGQLGISEEVTAKTVPLQNVNDVPKVVASGDAELGFAPATVLTGAPGIEVLGPFPSGLQDSIVYMAGVGSASELQSAGTAFIRHLTSPAAINLLKSRGFEVAP
jgi:molybdate transport system substrate-binding protein